MKNKSVLALGLVLTMSVSMVGCGSSKKTETEKVNVEVQTPQSGEVTLDTDYIGSVSPEQQVYVVPLVSGTVTQANYSVGDTVKEGDVLFKIDDEAAQLQMDNAKATYSQAQAGVNVATGGSRHLQNYQTEQGIDTLEDNLDKVRDGIKDMESQISELGDKETQLSQAVTGAKANADAKNQALAQEQVKLDNLKAELEKLQNPGNDESGNPISPDATAISAKQAEIQTQETVVANAKLELTQAQGALSEAQSGLSQVQSGKSQLESALAAGQEPERDSERQSENDRENI